MRLPWDGSIFTCMLSTSLAKLSTATTFNIVTLIILAFLLSVTLGCDSGEPPGATRTHDWSYRSPVGAHIAPADQHGGCRCPNRSSADANPGPHGGANCCTHAHPAAHGHATAAHPCPHGYAAANPPGPAADANPGPHTYTCTHTVSNARAYPQACIASPAGRRR